MTSTEASRIVRAVKTAKVACKVIRIGSGKNVQIMLEGRDAGRIAAALVAQGYVHTPLSSSSCITMDSN